jgi:UPF0176 protein
MKTEIKKKPLYDIILFYKYFSVRSPKSLQRAHFALCREFRLRGRVIVATEGINGTLEGTRSAVARYIKILRRDARFADIIFKHSTGTGSAFPKLSIKVRDEIVTLGVPVRNVLRGKYVRPRELHSWLKKNEDMTIIDVRNKYETQAGYFRNSLTSDISNFRDVPKLASDLQEYKEKKIVMVCTGGIRCEKASRLFRQKGYKNVYQLEGGIATYMKKYPGQDFLGSLYVFDDRILMQAGDENHTVVGKCAACSTPSERYTNCAYDPCHIHFICCKSCEIKHKGYCSQMCAKNKSTSLSEKLAKTR